MLLAGFYLSLIVIGCLFNWCAHRRGKAFDAAHGLDWPQPPHDRLTPSALGDQDVAAALHEGASA